VGVWQKGPFQAENLAMNLATFYQQVDREPDREMKLNTPKRGGNCPKFEFNGSGEMVDEIG